MRQHPATVAQSRSLRFLNFSSSRMGRLRRNIIYNAFLIYSHYYFCTVDKFPFVLTRDTYARSYPVIIFSPIICYYF
jgi:hypothetical protein